jgi:hypothetical protein
MTMTAEHDTANTAANENKTTVTVRAADFHNAIKNVVLFTSKDDTLPILTAAHMVIRNGNFIVEATDRYRLVQINVVDPQRSHEALIDGQLLSAAEDMTLGLLGNADLKKLEQLLRDAAKSKLERIVHLTFYGEQSMTVELEAAGTEPGMTMDYWQIVGEYPKINSLFDDRVPEAEASAVVAAFNPKYLQDVARLRDWREGPANQTIRTALFSGGKPATFHAVNSEGVVWAQAMLMPIRIPGNDDMKEALSSLMTRQF